MIRRALHVFPDYSAGNPYQAMLHARLDEVGAHAVPVPRLIPHLEVAATLPDPGVLALHWTGPILQGAGGPFRARLLLDRFETALDAFLRAGGRLVWTVHNVLPHDARHRWAEVELASFLADRADLVHVLSARTAEEVGDLYALDPTKVVVIEHSSYLGCYPSPVLQGPARERLGLAPDATVLVALGGIRPYKGLDRLLDVVEDRATHDPGLRLLVAGRPSETDDVAAFRARCERHDRVLARFEFLPDDELPTWLGAADLAVLPYRTILNSGTFHLAQTFGLPLVGPRAGALRDAEDLAHVTLFDPDAPGALGNALDAALATLRRDPAGQRASALAAAAANPPSAMAQRYAAAVAPLLGP